MSVSSIPLVIVGRLQVGLQLLGQPCRYRCTPNGTVPPQTIRSGDHPTGSMALLKAHARPYRGNTAPHRYARLLTCGDCGSTFVPRIRTRNGSRRVEYLCKSYMHHGKDFCPSHRIRESELNARVHQYAEAVRNQWIA